MVERFKGLRWVQQVKKGGRRNRPYCMTYPNGKNETKLNGMANVFRQFYEELYAAKYNSKNEFTFNAQKKTKLNKVTTTEVSEALKEQNKRKRKDTTHVTA